LGLKGKILFMEIVYFLFLEEGEGVQRPFSVFMSPKRWVRAAHGRARAAKTH
jgi:hypothetical protein